MFNIDYRRKPENEKQATEGGFLKIEEVIKYNYNESRERKC